MDFWILARSQNGFKTDPGKKDAYFGTIFFDFFALSLLGRVPEGSRSDSGGSGDPPGPDFGRICRYFLTHSAGILRVLLGSAGMVPGNTADLQNSLSGVLLGYGDLAQRIKFAVTHRGAGVLDEVPNSYRSPGGFPSLPPRWPPPDSRTVSCMHPNGLKTAIFRFFSALPKTVKKRTVKKLFVGAIFPIWGPSGANFRNFGIQNASPEGRFSACFRKTRFP